MNSCERNNDREAMSNLVPLYLKEFSVGNVHSKFNNGLNILIEEYLIYIGRCGTPVAAFGLKIADETLQQLLNLVKIGDLVVNKRGKFIFYSDSGVITVCYEELAEIDVRLPGVTCSVKAIPDSLLYQSLAVIEFEQFIGLELDEKTAEYVGLLVHCDKEERTVNSQIINFFTGRGQGLTPSGDDILLGFTLAIMPFGQFNAWKKALAMEVTDDKTTLISVAYLRALLAGYASEQFIRLVKLMDSTERHAIATAIDEARSFGHTSGNDTLFGFFLGLQYLIKPGKEQCRKPI